MTDKKTHIPDRALAEAGQWLARELEGNMSRTERADFEAWVDAYPDHQDAYIETHKTSILFSNQATKEGRQQLVEAAPELRPLIDECEDLSTLASKNSRLPFALGGKYGWISAIAACLLVVLVSGVIFFGNDPFANHYSTEVGELQTVMLEDGSIITLNTDTSLSVAFSDTERRILLKHGEAFFDVAKDKDRPFKVVAGKDIVQAVGTAFNVKKRADTTKVTVTEGVVEVKSEPFLGALTNKAGTNKASTNKVGPSGTISLAVGENLTISAAGTQNAVLSPLEVECIMAWRTGMLHFNGITLSNVVKELQYYAHKEIILTDEAVGELVVGGSLNTHNISAFLKGLELTFQIKVIERDTVIILSTITRQTDLSSI
ncbi:MAG: FecR domain-containing protein [Kordiimonadaceae bacterium]|nr:FecR domain-containing protein [Kordiimonadaceae bacterium]